MVARGTRSLAATITTIAPGRRPLLPVAGGERHAADWRRDDRHRRRHCGRAQAGRLGDAGRDMITPQRLRAFFLFAEARDWCRAGLAAGIMAPRFMADETVPNGLPRHDVVRPAGVGSGGSPGRPARPGDPDVFIGYRLRAGEVGGCDSTIWTGRTRSFGFAAPKPGRDRLLAAVAGRRRRHSALRTGGAAVRLRAQSLLHDARTDPAARPKSPPARWSATGCGHRRRHRATRGPRPSACRGPAPAG